MLQRSYGSGELRVPPEVTLTIMWGRGSEELKASEERGPSSKGILSLLLPCLA